MDKSIRIKTSNPEEELKLANSIHHQLAGNKDYIENRIVLSMSKDYKEADENELTIVVAEEADPVTITLVFSFIEANCIWDGDNIIYRHPS